MTELATLLSTTSRSSPFLTPEFSCLPPKSAGMRNTLLLIAGGITALNPKRSHSKNTSGLPLSSRHRRGYALRVLYVHTVILSSLTCPIPGNPLHLQPLSMDIIHCRAGPGALCRPQVFPG